MSYEEYTAGKVLEDLRSNKHFDPVTHLHVIHTLEALKLSNVASWYWAEHSLTEATLNDPA